VPDIFDEFLDELKRRQSGRGDAESGGDPDRPPSGAPGGSGGEPPPDRGRPAPRVVRARPPSGRRWPWIVIGLAFLLLLFISVGVNFWTDVLWFRSVGLEPVLWTRVGAAGTLFVFGTALALVVLLGNLALAGRLSPPRGPESGAGFAEVLDRMGRAAAGRRGWEPGPRPVVIDRDALPDRARIHI
jgi:hypothetical protein